MEERNGAPELKSVHRFEVLGTPISPICLFESFSNGKGLIQKGYPIFNKIL